MFFVNAYEEMVPLNIIIIGGGASGLAAAVRASENPENRVTLLERQSRVGRKLLSTGNGRCNLTNTGAARGNYHGESPDFVLPALAKYPPEAVLRFFASLGLETVTEYGGRVYPMSDHAGSVVDVLRLAVERPNVRVLTGAAVTGVRRGFTAEWDGGRITAEKMIVACGGCAGGKLGGVTDGYPALPRPQPHGAASGADHGPYRCRVPEGAERRPDGRRGGGPAG